ncbi:MAG TPA: VWA domain-containing protein, partial [Planctomycetaceae bacterium]|nr:VWA domain-containing protein [Planctomycetaceae bacterium]
MIGQRFIDSVLPRPRARFTWRSAWPLALFLLIYGGVCGYLELTHRVLFVRPYAFVLLVFSLWVWWMHLGGYAGLSRGRAAIALLMRLAILGLFVMLLAEPRAVRVRDVISVVYAVDVSDSIGEKSSDEALSFVSRTVGEKPRKDEAGLIVFGHNAAVELPPRPAFPFEGFVNSQIDKDATNLEQS